MVFGSITQLKAANKKLILNNVINEKKKKKSLEMKKNQIKTYSTDTHILPLLQIC
jgi:ribosomal protein S19